MMIPSLRVDAVPECQQYLKQKAGDYEKMNS